MSLFSEILNKLGLHKEQPISTAPSPQTTPAGKAADPAPTSEKGVRSTPSAADKRQREGVAIKEAAAPVPAVPGTISEVDVVKQLEQKAKGSGLNWKVSIADLLALLDIDNSREARNDLAKELGCPPEFMSDSAKMNTWLHKTVLRKIAQNGGNIPQQLLD